ncbi:Smg-4/UPF3 family-domain-containing protein [Cunninghamella echinulata]|nr:Smg-4/UPF3 family-domain-containing protein [Cunninghamella echinulata]
MADSAVVSHKSDNANHNETSIKDKQKIAEKKKKRRERKKKKSKRTKKNEPKTKVVVRRLPPNLPEDIFMNAVKQWTTDDLVDYKIYIPGKLTTNKSKESVFSRAYFHMKTIDAVIAFHQGFDGHIFMDSRGNESRAVVEFAPYQGIPKEHKMPDARQGTIEEDPDYQRFMDSLKAEENKPDSESEVVEGASQIERLENRIAMISAQTLATEQANKPKTTPLLEHLRAQKAAKAAAKAKKKSSTQGSSPAWAILAKKNASSSPSSSSSSPKPEAQEKDANDKSKKPPRRSKKKFEKEKERGGKNNEANNNKENNNKENDGSGTTTSKKHDDRPPRKFNKPPPSSAASSPGNGGEKSGSSSPSAKKDGANSSKPKRSRNYKDKKPKGEGKGSENGNNNNKPPVVKILGRQENSNTKAT